MLCLPPLSFGAFAAAVTFFPLRVAVAASAGCGCCVVTAAVAEPRLARAPATPPTTDAATTAPSATSGASPGASGLAASAVGCFRFVCFPFFACLAFGSLASSYICKFVQYRNTCFTSKHPHAYDWEGEVASLWCRTGSCIMQNRRALQRHTCAGSAAAERPRFVVACEVPGTCTETALNMLCWPGPSPTGTVSSWCSTKRHNNFCSGL